MSKSLVAYFSASGSTRRLAQRLAKVAGADLFEIVPERLYTAADLDWTDRNSRSTRERDPKCRPAVASTCDNMDDYDTVYVGFPIWWYVAPHHRQHLPGGLRPFGQARGALRHLRRKPHGRIRRGPQAICLRCDFCCRRRSERCL